MSDHRESAEAMYRPPAFELLTTASDVFNLEQPAPVLWRDPDPGVQTPATSTRCCPSARSPSSRVPADWGKACLTLALAVEAAIAAEDGREYGNACGLRVKAGGGVLVSYEDSPARIGNRLRWFTKTAPEGLHLWANPEPLFQTDPENRGAVTKCAAWEQLWTEIKAVRPALVIIDPVSAALADADTSQTGPARTFIRELSQEAAIADCGVLLVAHDTKSARNQAMAGQDPGAGAVAGSAAWYDGARGVLTLVPAPITRGGRLLVAIKANYGRTGWGAQLTERYEAGRFRGLELQARMEPAGVEQWREGVERKAKRGREREEATDV